MKFNIRTNEFPEKTLPIEIHIPDELWKNWYDYQRFDNRVYDTDECQECGWMSPEHLRDISAFIYNQTK